MGESVPLEQDYFYEEYEIADSYEVQVDCAQVLTYSEFLKKYN